MPFRDDNFYLMESNETSYRDHTFAKLDFGDGFELEDEPEKRTDAPFDFEITHRSPPARVYVGDGFYQPKVYMEIMITAIDKKANILYSIEYLKFVESVLPRILQQLPVFQDYLAR